MTTPEKEICETVLKKAYEYMEEAKEEKIKSEKYYEERDEVNYVIRKCNSNYFVGQAKASYDILLKLGYKNEELEKLDKVIMNYWSEN